MVFITAIAGREPQFVMNIEGTEAVQLTHDDADHEDPAWSPRGDKIAFVRIKDSLETMVAGRRRDPIGTRTIRSSR
jgi:Tol biopolymer transport system component